MTPFDVACVAIIAFRVAIPCALMLFGIVNMTLGLASNGRSDIGHAFYSRIDRRRQWKPQEK